MVDRELRHRAKPTAKPTKPTAKPTKPAKPAAKPPAKPTKPTWPARIILTDRYAKCRFLFMPLRCCIKMFDRKPGDVANLGKDCWKGCHKRDGVCSWCGEHGKGMCCRKGWKRGACNGKVGGERRHE